CLKQRFGALPSFAVHVRPSRPSSRVSHAFAVRHSRLAVVADTLSTQAVSSIVSPPNARSSTTCASDLCVCVPQCALGGCRGHLEYTGRLFDREPAERSKFHHARETFIERRKAIECMIQGEHRNPVRGDHVFCLIDRHGQKAVTAFARTTAAGMIHENPAHH